jgi:chromosome segregation ATPase
MSGENGLPCGLGEGTHYGCECVMRRIADLESALSASEARAKELERERDEARREATAFGQLCESTVEQFKQGMFAAQRERAAAEARREEAERRLAVAEALNPAAVSLAAFAKVTAALTARAERAESALVARHGGEPLALIGELDEARAERDEARRDARATVEANRLFGDEAVILRTDLATAESRAEALAKALREVEWQGEWGLDRDGNSAETCPACHRAKPNGHTPDCTLARALSVGVSRTDAAKEDHHA